MGLLTKITLGLAVIVGGVAIAVPTIYKTKINDVLVQNQSKLEREGMIVSLLNDNDNFFNALVTSRNHGANSHGFSTNG